MNAIKPNQVNNFDVLRLVSALLVIFAHSYTLFGIDVTKPIVADNFVVQKLLQFWQYLQLCAGDRGVEVFFVISGYLISKSIISNPNQWIYWQKRCLRIFPGLIVCVLFITFVMGPLFTALPFDKYIKEPEAWWYLICITMFKLKSALPDVFLNHPEREVNGSLWTLRYEFTCYMMVAFFSLIGLINKKWVMLGLYVVVLLFLLYIKLYPLTPKFESVLIYTDLVTSKLAFFVALFLTGVVYNLFQKVLKIQGWQAALAFAATVVITNFPDAPFTFLMVPLSGIMIFYLSYIPLPEKVKYPLGHNDYSYGIYVYGMPVQQMVYAIIGTALGINGYILLCMLVVIGFAFLSWHFVEKPMLSLKPKTA